VPGVALAAAAAALPLTLAEAISAGATARHRQGQPKEQRNREGEKMTPQYPTRDNAPPSPSRRPSARVHATKRPVRRRSVRTGLSVPLSAWHVPCWLQRPEPQRLLLPHAPLYRGASSSPRVARSPGTALARPVSSLMAV
jgi:hypothetical protein